MATKGEKLNQNIDSNIPLELGGDEIFQIWGQNLHRCSAVQSIRRFISQLADRSQQFNKNLHKWSTCVWNALCENIVSVKGNLVLPLVHDRSHVQKP